MLLRILVYAVALSLFLLLGWLAHRLLTPAPAASAVPEPGERASAEDLPAKCQSYAE